MKLVTLTSATTGNPIIVNLERVNKISHWLDDDGKTAGTALSFDNDTVFVKEAFKSFLILMQAGRVPSVSIPE